LLISNKSLLLMGKKIYVRWTRWNTQTYDLSEIKEVDYNYFITHKNPSYKHQIHYEDWADFAAQFPMIPFSSEKYEEIKRTKYQQGLDTKFDKLSQEIQELRQENIKLLSHLEAIMIAIGNRSILADNIKL
jgi:hypothetical protein